MKPIRWEILTLAVLVSGCGAFPGSAAGVTSNDWTTCTPEAVGLDSAALVEMFDHVRERRIPVHSVQIVRHGRLALDAYFYPYDFGTRHDVASVTKSITSTVVGLAIAQGSLRSVKQPMLSEFTSQSGGASRDERKRKITIEHLLTMRAGWDCGFEPREARLAQMRRSEDWLSFMLDLPMVAEPGTRWAYCSGNCHVLSMLLTRKTGTNAWALAQRTLFAPLGIHDVFWPSDMRGNSHGWGDLQMHPRDMAKLGQLFLQQGRWGDRQIIPKTWVKTATRAHAKRTSNQDQYGYFWWVKGRQFPGMFEAVGRGGQRITVWPEKELVVVFTGGGFEPGDLAPFLLKALKSDGALPANREGLLRLEERISAATKPPAPAPRQPIPPLATRVSGKKYRLSANNLELKSLTLEFPAESEARAELAWERQSFNVRIGLDGTQRFSTNPLTRLPQAAAGEWSNGQTFSFKLDLVGGINFYHLRFKFSEDGHQVSVTLHERTGLNDEVCEGTLE